MSSDLFRTSVRALLRNKTRSALTMLGIVIGIAGVITTRAVGEGASRQVERQIRSMGSNMILIMPGAVQTGGVSLGGGTRNTLTDEDARAIQDSVPHVKAVSPVIQTRGQLVYGSENWAPASIRGEGEDYLQVKAWEMVEGEFFDEDDVRAARKVCVIGQTVQENLFPDESPVGKTVRLKNMPFRIIGVLDRKGSAASGEDQDDVVILPWTTAKHVLQGSRFNNVDLLLISSDDPDAMTEVEGEVSSLLRQRHRLSEDQPEDFRTLTMVQMVESGTASARIMTTFIASVAALSLLVGGVGIMNIMLVTVRERTREIGLRMAVGARRRDILSQFLFEGVLMTLLGGTAGILSGVLASKVVSRVLNWPVYLSPGAVILAVLCTGVVGVFFSFYPSLRASRLDPIIALRSE